MKKTITAEIALELLEWWHRLDRTNRAEREVWAEAYKLYDPSDLDCGLRVQLDLINRLNNVALKKV